MDTRRKLRAWELLQKNGIQYLHQWEDLKYLLAPFFAQNAKQQQLFYDIFEAFQEECKQLELPRQKTWWEKVWGSVWGKIGISTGIPVMLLLAFLWALPLFYVHEPTMTYFEGPQRGRLLVGEEINLVNITPTDGRIVWDLWGIHLMEAEEVKFFWEIAEIESERTLPSDDAWKIILQDTASQLKWVIPDSLYGRRLSLGLRGGEALLKFPFGRKRIAEFYTSGARTLHTVSCSDPPQIQQDLISPASDTRLSLDSLVSFSFDQKLDSGEQVFWYFADTTIAGAQVNYVFRGNEDQIRIQLEVKRDIFCYSKEDLTYNLTDSKPVVPLMALKKDEPDITHTYSELYGLLSLIPALLGILLLWWWWRERQPEIRQKVAEGDEDDLEVHDVAPYNIPWASRDHWIDVPFAFYRMADILRRREEDLRKEFDGEKSIRSAIEKGGFPAWEEKAMMRSSEYLILIRRKDEFNQKDRLFTRLAEFFQQQEAPVTVCYHSGGFENFWQPQQSRRYKLNELNRAFPRHRLIILGDAHGLVNPYASLAPSLHNQPLKELLQWERRIIFTPESPQEWSFQEALLHPHFLLYPATTASIREGLSVLDRMEEHEPEPYAAHERQIQRKYPLPAARYRTWETVSDVREYLQDESLFRWLAALAVHHEPDWALTIATGRALGIAVTHDRLLLLSRIPWFADNSLNNSLRLDFLRALSDDDAEIARRTALVELEDEEVKKQIQGSFAELSWQATGVVHRFALQPRLPDHKDELRTIYYKGLLSLEQEQELTFIIQEKADATGLSPNATNSIEDWLEEPEPKPWLTWKLVMGALLTLLGLGMLLNGLLVQMNPKEGVGVPPLEVDQIRMDSAMAYYNRAVDIAQYLDGLATIEEWRDKRDTLEGKLEWLGNGNAPESAYDLIQSAKDFRAPDRYPLADSAYLLMLYNEQAQQLNFCIKYPAFVGLTGYFLGGNPSFTSTFQPTIDRGIAVNHQGKVLAYVAAANEPYYLNVQHLRGLYNFYFYREFERVYGDGYLGDSLMNEYRRSFFRSNPEVSNAYINSIGVSELDSARKILQDIQLYSRGRFFDSIASVMPVNLKTLLEEYDRANPSEAEPEPEVDPNLRYIKVQLVDRVSLAPIANAPIKLEPGGSYTTDAQGEISVPIPPDTLALATQGIISVEAQPQGYLRTLRYLQPLRGNASVETFFLDVLDPAQQMVIQLVDAEDVTQRLRFSGRIFQNTSQNYGAVFLPTNEENTLRLPLAGEFDEIYLEASGLSYDRLIRYTWDELIALWNNRDGDILQIPVFRVVRFELKFQDSLGLNLPEVFRPVYSPTGEPVENIYSYRVFYIEDEDTLEVTARFYQRAGSASGSIPYTNFDRSSGLLVEVDQFEPVMIALEDFSWQSYPDNVVRQEVRLRSDRNPNKTFSRWLRSTELGSYLSFEGVTTAPGNGEKVLNLSGQYASIRLTKTELKQLITSDSTGFVEAAMKRFVSIYNLDKDNAVLYIFDRTGNLILGYNDKGALIFEVEELREAPNIDIEDDSVSLPDSIPLPSMIFIPGGTFQMGSDEGRDNERPIYEVTLSDFYLAETEVTFAQYDFFCEATGREKPSDQGWGRGARPVINVSWEDAQAYCQWVSDQTGLKYRLPTEAEWEYAAGGGVSNRTKYAGTDIDSLLDQYAVYNVNQTAPVKTKKINTLGLYDMSGNVWEWCQDWYGSYSSSSKANPEGPESGNFHVVRGGSWLLNVNYCRVASRSFNHPDDDDFDVGFRVCRY